MPWGVTTVHGIQLTTQDDAWRGAVAALGASPILATLDVAVDVSRAREGGPPSGRVLLERTEPRAIWQTALSVQSNLRGLGYDASVGVDPGRAASDATLRLSLEVAGDADAQALERLLRGALAPVLARPVAAPTLPPPPRHVIPTATFEVV